MVAGWDHLLPQWFTRLPPKYKTPVNSILFGSALILGLGLLSLIGAGNQEAFQVLWNGAAMFYALTYLVMFALPLFGLRGVEPRPPVWLRIAAASGFLMTLLNVVFALFPIVQVESRWGFAAKLIAVIRGALRDGATGRPIAAKIRVTNMWSGEAFLSASAIKTMPGADTMPRQALLPGRKYLSKNIWALRCSAIWQIAAFLLGQQRFAKSLYAGLFLLTYLRGAVLRD